MLACNVYISAGGLRRHGSILMDLLKETQDRCSRQNASPQASPSSNEVCVVVHAFSDAVYNRSSIHLAGSEGLISSVVSDLVRDAQGRLTEDEKIEKDPEKQNNDLVHHPFVGLVDHVSVLPLGQSQEEISTDDKCGSNSKNQSNNNHNFKPTTPWGRAARAIGKSISLYNTEVFYYGSADPHNTPLAEVRRNKTKFFQSGGLDQQSTSHQLKQATPKNDIATVGAPSDFVENFNIRLTRNCSKKIAQSLTRFVRERDGGLPGVEALTLPYSDDTFEVACNLLQPQVGSAEAIQGKVQEWASSQMIATQPDAADLDLDYYVEKAYRVGTTADLCRDVLALVAQSSDNRVLEVHNEKVRGKLENCLRW